MRLGLATRLALTVALFLIPAAAWIGYTVQQESEQVTDTVEARLNVQLNEVIAGVEHHIVLAHQTLRILAEVPELHADTDTCNRFLEAFGRTEGAFLAFMRARPDGLVDCATPGLEVPFPVGHRSHFHQTIATGEFTVGSFQYEDYAGLPVVTTAYPLYNETGGLEGAVMTASAVSNVLQVDRVQTLPEDAVVTVTDAKGVIIARSGPTSYTGETFGDRQNRLGARPGEVYLATGVDGIERLYVSDRITIGEEAQTLIVNTGVPVGAAYAPVLGEAIQGAIFIIGLLVLMGAAGILAFRHVVLRPIKQIAATADALRGGDLDARVPAPLVTRTDQIGDLANVLNTTADELAHQIQKLEDANKRLDQVDHLKTQIINTVAHELRTPMVSLKLQVALLEKQIPGGDVAAEALERVDRNVVRLDRLIQSLIKVAKIMAERIDLTPHPIPLVPLLEAVAQQWRPRAEEAGIALQVASAPLMARADPHALREVLDELLDNALKFTPPGGTVRMGVDQLQDGVSVTVADTGVGLRLEHVDVENHLEPFGDPVRGGRIGIGVGLFIARALVEQMGGSLSHESEGREQGTRAIIRLRAA